MTRRYTHGLVIASLLCLAMTACNKEIETAKVINVTLHGYNISDAALEVSVDTVVFDQDLQKSNERINFSKVYSYSPGKGEATVRVKDQTSGKELFQRTLSLSGGQLEFYFSFINIHGNLLEVTPPAADSSTNKLGFYIYYPESKDPIDIILYNPNNGAQVYLAQNVLPQTWVYTDYLPGQGLLGKNDVGSSIVYFTKAGTFDWAFNDSESQSQASAFSWYFPHAGYSLGKVQPYFIRPSAQGWEAEVVRLFLNPTAY